MGAVEEHAKHTSKVEGCPICALRKDWPDPNAKPARKTKVRRAVEAAIAIPDALEATPPVLALVPAKAKADTALADALAAKVGTDKPKVSKVRKPVPAQPGMGHDAKVDVVIDGAPGTPPIANTPHGPMKDVTPVEVPALPAGAEDMIAATDTADAALADGVMPDDNDGLDPEPVKAPKAKAGRKPTFKFETREAWMLAAVEAMRPWFAEHGEKVPPVRISIGWPGGRGSKVGVLGQCWAPSAVEDSIPAIFVTPTQKDAVEVLETIGHELIHACGHFHHRAEFQKVAKGLGFTNGGKVKTTRADSPDLYKRLDRLAKDLGPFPHGAVRGEGGLLGGDPKAPPVQSTRMLKVSCPSDGYTLRATSKWLKIAVPECPVCSGEMDVEWTPKSKRDGLAALLGLGDEA